MSHELDCLRIGEEPRLLPLSFPMSLYLKIVFFFVLFFLCFASAAFCVYEVYSWDVMEPFTYFLMVCTGRRALQFPFVIRYYKQGSPSRGCCTAPGGDAS